MNVLTKNKRGLRFVTTLGVVWAIWVPLLATEQARDFLTDHPFLGFIQAPLVATVTLLIGEIGRARAAAAEPAE